MRALAWLNVSRSLCFRAPILCVSFPRFVWEAERWPEIYQVHLPVPVGTLLLHDAATKKSITDGSFAIRKGPHPWVCTRGSIVSMVDTGTYSTPSLGGTIASRYLEAISCGGQDLSALTIGSSGSRWTPERPKIKSIHRKVLNDSSCGMTAPTAALETSASWSSKETPSRSDAASRRSNTTGRLTSQMMSAETRFATSPARKMGMEDECSSIDSSSSHQRNRPAHLSLQIDTSFGDTSFEYESFSRASSPGVPSPSRIMQKARKHLAQRRRQHVSLTPNRNNPTNVFACGPTASFFPKTSPRTPPNQLKTNNAIPPSPHQSRLAGKWKPSVDREGNTDKRPGLSWTQKCLGEEVADSVAGAPTEVITNRTRDLLNRSALSTPREPPQVRRWTPSADSNAVEAQLMHSLMDDASTNEDSSARSDRKHLRALFDGPSSSISPTQSADTSKLDARVERQQKGKQPPDDYLSSADSSVDKVGESDPKRVTVSSGKAVFGGREVGAGSRPVRKWSATARGFHPTDTTGKPPTEDKTQQQPLSPVRFFMEEDPIPQPRTPQPASSGEVTSSVSTTDGFLVPDFAERSRGATTFIRYNARKTPNAHEVFQRRYSDSSNTSTLSTSDKEHDEHLQPSRPPIQPLFSLDRLDFSDDAPSPIRKCSQSTYQGKQTLVLVPTRSKSCTERVPTHGVLERIEERRQVDNNLKAEERYKNSEAAHRFAVKMEASSQAIAPDPIFCPAGSISSSPTQSSENGATSRSSHEDYINVGRSAATAGKNLERNDSTSTGVIDEHQGIIEERKKYQNTSSARGVSHGTSKTETKVTRAVKENSSVVPPKRKNSVHQIIQAYNVPDRFNQSHDNLQTKGNVARTSRESLVMGARIARLVNEEKKDETNYGGDDHHDMDDTGSVRSLREKFEKRFSSQVNALSYAHNDDADDGSIKSLDEKFKKHEFTGSFFFGGAHQDDDDDDGTGSVRSLREKFEKQFKKDSSPRSSENDDSFSVKSLRDKLERYWAKDGISDDDDDVDDEGSVRSLREKFEPPKKRESQAMVSNLRSVFEPKRSAVKLPRKSRIDTKKVAPRAASIIQDVPRVVTPVGASAPSSVVQDGPHAWRDTAVHVSDHSPDAGSQGAQIDVPRVSMDTSERSTQQTIDRFIQQTNSEKSAKATKASMQRDEDDTISTHSTSSRLREPAHTSFLSMRDRLLKFAKEQPTPAITIQQKKPPPPSMHERLNLWANRHQNRNRAQAESIGENKAPVKATEETKISKQTAQSTKPSSGGTSGFFSRTNDVVKTRQMAGGQMQRHDRSHDHEPSTGNIAIFRGGQIKQSAADAFKPVVGEKHYSKRDWRVKSNDTDISDGVTLDPSIADVSILTDPTIHRLEENVEVERGPSAIPSPIKKSEISSIPEPEKLSTAIAADPRLQSTIHDQKDSVSSRNKGDIVLEFEYKATKNVEKPSIPGAPKELHHEDKGWAKTNTLEPSFSSQPPSHNTKNDRTGKQLHGSGWPQMDSDGWIDFSPSRTNDERKTETDKLNQSERDRRNHPFSPHPGSSSNGLRDKKENTHDGQKLPPRTPSVPVAAKQTANNYRNPPSIATKEAPPTKIGARDKMASVPNFDSKTTSLVPMSSPFDEDYNTLMDARHKMLLSRQRSHQERKIARETARVTPRSDFPAEAPGLTMTDFDPMITPFLDASRHKAADVSGIRSNFFSRTHPNSVVPTTSPAKQSYRTNEYHSKQSLSPKDAGSRTRPSPQAGESNQAMQKLNEEPEFPRSDAESSSIFSRLSESMGLSDDTSRQDTLVARLQSVKAARIRRKTPTNQSAPDDEDLDASETTIRTGRKTKNPVRATPPRARDDQPAVVSSREAFERYMASSRPPPPPPPPSPPPSSRPPASYRMSTRPMAVTKPLETREIKPTPVQLFDTDPFHPSVSKSRDTRDFNPSSVTRFETNPFHPAVSTRDVKPSSFNLFDTNPFHSAVSKPLDTRDVNPSSFARFDTNPFHPAVSTTRGVKASSANLFDTNPFHPAPEPTRPLQNGMSYSTPRRYVTPPLPPPTPPPPPRYPNTGNRYRPTTKPMIKFSNNTMGPDDELDKDSSSSSNSSNFFREGLTLD